jgi:hypothetical protein
MQDWLVLKSCYLTAWWMVLQWAESCGCYIIYDIFVNCNWVATRWQ